MPDLFSIVQPVIDSGIETRKIDLKREVDLSGRPQRAKFAKLISALVNTSGGAAYMVVGVADLRERIAGQGPEGYVVGFDPDRFDDFQRAAHQALETYIAPIPEVECLLVEDPRIKKQLCVVRAERSHQRPHAVIRDSDGVHQGVYFRRGSDTRLATPVDIDRMRRGAGRLILDLNRVRPLTELQLQQLEEALDGLPEVIEATSEWAQFDHRQPFDAQARLLLDSLNVTLEEWGNLAFVVNLPGLAPVAAALLAELHGRCGSFPHVLRLRPTVLDSNVFEVAEILKLQDIRNSARARTTLPT